MHDHQSAARIIRATATVYVLQSATPLLRQLGGCNEPPPLGCVREGVIATPQRHDTDSEKALAAGVCRAVVGTGLGGRGFFRIPASCKGAAQGDDGVAGGECG